MIEILSTRSLPSKEIKEARQKGVRIICKDFISISPIKSSQLDAQLSIELNHPNLRFIFTSKNAVRIAVSQYFSTVSPSIKRTWQFYCLSGATKMALLQSFEEDQIKAEGPHADSLIREIPWRDIHGDLHFFCSSRRRNTLPDFMKERSISFKEWRIYDTKNKARTVREQYNGYLFYSPSAVESFFSLNSLSDDKVCFGIGSTTAAALHEVVSNRVVIGNFPDTAHLLTAVYHYFGIK